MSSAIRYQYYVEGPCEKKLLEELKRIQAVIAGRVNIFNAAQNAFTQERLRLLSPNTVAILLLDTDAGNYEILSKNIRLLKNNRSIKDVWLVLQVNNLEEELLRAADVRDIKDLIGAKSNKDFKSAFISEKNLMVKLIQHNIKYECLWMSEPNGIYKDFENDGWRIKRLDFFPSKMAR